MNETVRQIVDQKGKTIWTQDRSKNNVARIIAAKMSMISLKAILNLKGQA